MKALVKFGEGDGDVELREVHEPTMGADDVLLEVKAAGICGFDIEMWRHKTGKGVTIQIPVIMGHEFSGVIKEVGEKVRGFEQGERVVSETAAEICGQCPQCRGGNYHLCAERKGFGYGVDGAFARLARVPERCLHRIPENVSFDHACLTEPSCVAYQAIVVQSKINAGTGALIIGPGPIGLLCLQMAKACGAEPIIIAGTDADSLRLEVARELGADVIINVSKDDPMAIINEETKGNGVPLVADAAGNEKALKLSMDAVARGGQITKIGWGPKPVNQTLDPLLTKSVRMQGSFSHNWPTWEAVLGMMSRGSLKIEPMISRRISLDDWREAFEQLERREAIKIVVNPS